MPAGVSKLLTTSAALLLPNACGEAGRSGLLLGFAVLDHDLRLVLVEIESGVELPAAPSTPEDVLRARRGCQLALASPLRPTPLPRRYPSGAHNSPSIAGKSAP